MSLPLSRAERASDRRSWSKDILCTHRERADGQCSSCSSVDCAVAWPCLTVRAALVYLGREPARPRARPPVAPTRPFEGAILPRVS